VMLHISEHAINRYRERVVGHLSEDNALARLEIFARIEEAKPRYIRRLGGGRKTVMLPLHDCLLVFSKRTMVTVLERRA
jgi:hypothetical protein